MTSAYLVEYENKPLRFFSSSQKAIRFIEEFADSHFDYVYELKQRHNFEVFEDQLRILDKTIDVYEINNDWHYAVETFKIFKIKIY